MYKIDSKLTIQWELVNFGANHVLCMEVTYKTMEDNSRNISLIGEVENSSRERALVAQRLETGFLTVRSRVWFPPGSVSAHCWRVPNRTKQLSSAAVSFRLSTLLIRDEFLIKIIQVISEKGGN